MTNSSAEREPIIDEYGNKRWENEEGKIHRTDGPAHEGANGTKQWFINGKIHRTDGPAVEYPDGSKSWYIDGKKYSEAEYNALRCSVCARVDCPTKN